MSRIFPQIIDAVGATPLVRLNSLTRGLGATHSEISLIIDGWILGLFHRPV